jgi:hypothetical protein
MIFYRYFTIFILKSRQLIKQGVNYYFKITHKNP